MILREAPSPPKLVDPTNSWRKVNDFFRLFGVPGHPLGASGPSYLAIFPICFAISAIFPQKNSPKLLSIQKYRVFFDFPCSWTPKIIENQRKSCKLRWISEVALEINEKHMKMCRIRHSRVGRVFSFCDVRALGEIKSLVFNNEVVDVPKSIQFLFEIK